MNAIKTNRWTKLLVLALGAGIIFQLPYLRLAFYTQLQDALGLNHTQYGTLMSVYAIVAMLSYFPGGWLADQLSPKKMLTFSLISTGLSGLYFSTFPSYITSLFLHGFWGITTILTYWAALLKITRTLGDENEQGRLFGLLEGGRGLGSAVGAYALLALYAKIGAGAHGMAWVIRIFAVLHLLVGLFTWFVINDPEPADSEIEQQSVIKNLLTIIKMPQVWLLCGIIFTTYSAYAGMTYIAPYLQDVYGASTNLSTTIGIFQRYVMMLIGGALGGIVADKIGSRTKVILFAFIALSLSLVVFFILPGNHTLLVICTINILILAGSVYVLRGLYFSIINEIKIPLCITGTVVGFASLVGYIPDTFIYTLIGSWLDNNEGSKGYNNMFLLLLVMAILGTIFILLIRKFIKPSNLTLLEKPHLQHTVPTNYN